MRRTIMLIPVLVTLGGCIMAPGGGGYDPFPGPRQRAPQQDTGWRYIPGAYGPQVGEGYTSGGYAQQSPYPFGHWRRGPDPTAARSTENAGN